MRSSNAHLVFAAGDDSQFHLSQLLYGKKVEENEQALKEFLERSRGDVVTIDVEGKLRGYALNPLHPTGKNKARVFKSALGFTQAGAENLEKQIREQVRTSEWKEAGTSDFGKKYTVDVEVHGKNGKTATVRTGWIVEAGAVVPRLTSAYVLAKKGGGNA